MLNINQQQFEHILDILILYKQLNPNKDVYLNENSIKEAFHFMNTRGKDFASQIGLKND